MKMESHRPGQGRQYLQDSEMIVSIFFFGRVTENVFLFLVINKRPKRVNQGQGGAIAQLQAISDQISEKGKPKKHKDRIPMGIPANAMASVGRNKVS
jgi:hypothetical protein